MTALNVSLSVRGKELPCGADPTSIVPKFWGFKIAPVTQYNNNKKKITKKKPQNPGQRK